MVRHGKNRIPLQSHRRMGPRSPLSEPAEDPVLLPQRKLLCHGILTSTHARATDAKHEFSSSPISQKGEIFHSNKYSRYSQPRSSRTPFLFKFKSSPNVNPPLPVQIQILSKRKRWRQHGHAAPGTPAKASSYSIYEAAVQTRPKGLSLPAQDVSLLSLLGDTMRMSPFLVLLIAFLSAHAPLQSEALDVRGRLLKSKTFLSPAFPLRPGAVSNKFYHDIGFPRGHLALKSFSAEVVDENGAPVPLHETYLHHWIVEPFHVAKTGAAAPKRIVAARNSGVCGGDTLGQYYGLGSETRRTATWVPDPYAIEIGNPPEGYEERWLLNVHAIDTRGVKDKLGCTECRCDLYNVTVDEYGRRIAENYTGGLLCCYDRSQCEVREGFDGGLRKLFLRYTVTWLDWSDDVVPVKIYIFDVSDRALLEGKSEPACKVEYQVKECGSENRARNDCVDNMVAKQVIPRGGDIVFGVAHQHSGGIGAALHGQDGRLLCASMATYGQGQEAGNEAGYIVGMSTCYPKPGTVRVSDGEVLTIVSNYSNERQHTGVMGLFYILVAEQQQPAANKPPGLCFSFPVSWCLPAWLSSKL